VNWKKSITKYAITCLECGQSFKQLSLRHLSQHGLDSWSYRVKYGIPRTQPLSAKATTAKRREIAQAIKPWERTPRALQAKEEQAKAAKKAVRRTRKQVATAQE
jgi:predicted transcriptional regulator